MRLINVQDFSLIEVNGPDDYPYAILSHTWSKTGEVSYDDMKDLSVARTRSEWAKIEVTCALAQTHEIPVRYVWIDTCCINKSSSAELTEAINSMFEWYKKAARCYAYLSDLPASPNGNPASARAKEQLRADLARCLWFSRGWTLQELIAPKAVEFYDSNWTYRGTKADLGYEISRITDIDMSVLSNCDELSTIPVARKMSWAARRITTRPEDIAYCLLGIFGVNLPLIYGEGAKAFIRLQEVIAQSTNDLSLFAWSEDEHNPRLQSYYGILAQSPQQFASCRRLEVIPDPLRHDTHFFTITNRGVEFQTSLNMDFAEKDYLMHLYCRDGAVQRPKGRYGMIAIRLVKTSSGFVRHRVGGVFVDDNDTTASSPSDAPSSIWDHPFMRPVNIPQLITPAESTRLASQRLHEAFMFKVVVPPGVTYELVTHNPTLRKSEWDPGSLRPSYWDPAGSVFLTEGYEYFTGFLYITFSSAPYDPFVVMCGLMPRVASTLFSSEKARQGGSESRVEAWFALRPPPRSGWAAGFASSTRVEDRIVDLQDIVPQQTDVNYPQFLTRLGQAIRSTISSGKVLPERATRINHRSRCGVVKVTGATRVTDTGRIHHVQISYEELVVPAQPFRQ